MNSKPTLVLGASPNPYRYAHRAIEMLRDAGQEVLALGNRPGTVRDVDIHTDPAAVSDQPLHTLTLYLNPGRQEPFYEQILAWKPQRVIFNPGTENPELAAKLAAAGIEPVYACTLVMLSTGQY
ncbi:MAG: CoA-binding protein [Bacteroidetes bacterium]|nr:MAG: CoA-binding protein [Bacteroidota bacterium]